VELTTILCVVTMNAKYGDILLLTPSEIVNFGDRMDSFYFPLTLNLCVIERNIGQLWHFGE